ncbi:MAG: hypothetical protein RMM58_01235 [Chloroflexota bacterium]|nr:hypothetical protein [Dehalococcoidia bacterium]MDW8252482.1 hypothetical protein [Chloroflexota bacterium]
MELERAVVVSFDAATYTATVRLERSLSGVQSGVAVARHLAAWQLKPGDEVVVGVWDALVASERCVIASLAARRRPMCRVRRTTSQPIPSGTQTALAFDVARYDTDGMWSAEAPTRLTIQTAGRYHVGFAASFDEPTGAGSVRGASLWVNGALVIATVVVAPRPGGTQTQIPVVSGDYLFSAGEYLEGRVVQDSGGSVPVFSFSAWSPELWAHWIEA